MKKTKVDMGKVIKIDIKGMADELAKMKEVPLHEIVIDTGCRDYGPPSNAAFRRM